MTQIILRWRTEYNLRVESGKYSKPVMKAWSQGIALALGGVWKKDASKIHECIAHGMHI